MFKTRKEVEAIKEKYKVGLKIKTGEVQGEPRYSGLTGVVKNVDDIGQVHTVFTNGSKLGLDPDIDEIEILE